MSYTPDQTGPGGNYPGETRRDLMDASLEALAGEPTWSQKEIEDYWADLEAVREEARQLEANDAREYRTWQHARYLG